MLDNINEINKEIFLLKFPVQCCISIDKMTSEARKYLGKILVKH